MAATQQLHMTPQTIPSGTEGLVPPCTCPNPVTASEHPAETAYPIVLGAQSVSAPKAKSSYGQILKSSALVGGAQAANIAIGVVRTKAMAVLLGPAGFGLFGLYSSIIDLTQNIAGMGVNSSGVRQIAEAVGCGNQNKIARTTTVLRRTSIALGVFGAGLLVVFCRQISGFTFGTTQRATSVALLSAAVLFRLVSAGQGALIQGMRRVADLARMNVLSALFGAAIAIPLVYFFGEKGIVPSLVCITGMTIGTSWWYSRKIRISELAVTMSEVGHEVGALLKLGFAFMASGLMTVGVAYAIRIILLRNVGPEAMGFYQSAWTLGGLYVGFILQAMGADFYPRLTASAHNNAECNRLVNEQALVGLLLAAPGVIATLTFAPLVITLFYSGKFGAAVPILRWICLGIMLQAITWPMGFIVIAKGKQGIFFFAELVWGIVALGLAWVCIRSFGLNGAGIAFFGSYVFHWILLYPIVRLLSGFRWSMINVETGLVFMSMIAVVFAAFYRSSFSIAIGIGVLALLLSTAYSAWCFSRLFSFHQLPRTLQRLISGLRLGPSA